MDEAACSGTSRPTTSPQEQLVEEMNAALTYPGRLERLDHADQGPHRHADDRDPHAGRAEDLRRRSRGDREDRHGRSRRCCPRCAARAACSPSAPAAATSSTSIWNRDALARYGLSIETAQSVVQNAIGGENVTTTVEGRERYPVNVRYMRDFRSRHRRARARARAGVGRAAADPARRAGATSRSRTGPAMIRDEDGLLTGYVYVDVARPRHRQLCGGGEAAWCATQVKLPPGYAVLVERPVRSDGARARAAQVSCSRSRCSSMLLLLYLNTRSLAKTAIVLLAVPFSAVGAIWFLYLLGYNMSIAVWVGLIALLGVDAETGVFMLLYLDLAYDDVARRDACERSRDLRRRSWKAP